MQQELNELEKYCNKRKMRINSKKTKAMLFNTKIKTDFQPELCLQDRNLVEVVEEIKLFGVVVTSD